MISSSYATAVNPYHGRMLLPKPSEHSSVSASAADPKPRPQVYVSVAVRPSPRLAPYEIQSVNQYSVTNVVNEVGCQQQSRMSQGHLLTRIVGMRCDGKNPQCSACIKSKVLCNYGLPRKQLKQRLLKDKQILVTLAKDLRSRVNEADRTRIDTVLQEVSISSLDRTQILTNSRSEKTLRICHRSTMTFLHGERRKRS